MSEAGAGSEIDTGELRRRIALTFSLAELRSLALELGLAAAGETKEDLAREIVKQAPRFAGLRTLVAKLRERKPLVEWPETPIPPGAHGTIADEPLIEALEPEPEPDVARPEVAPTAALGAEPTIVDAPSARVAAEARADASADSTSSEPVSTKSAAKPSPASAPAAWPGTVEPPPQKPAARGLDPRLVLIAAAIGLVAAVVAFVAGRSSASPSSAAPSSAASARRAQGPATEVADAIARGLANVARVCEVPPGAATDLFARVRERCGPPPPPKRALPIDRAGLDPAPPPVDEPDVAQRPARPTRVVDPTSPAASPCLRGCDGEHRACKSRCGPEPTESTKYGDYQQCLGRCLAGASRCKLACNE